MSTWTCQYPGCSSTPAQLAELRVRRPEGFPHGENPSLRVCTVCRRLPLKMAPQQAAPVDEPPLDAAFLTGIKEELSSLEESEQNVQSLSQVFRFHAKHARQLAQLLADHTTKQCFPWELIHAMHLLDDILLMDKTGRYKAELAGRVQSVAVHAFRKVQSDAEKREIARMVHAWQELKIFDTAVLQSIKAAIRAVGEQAGRILDEEGDAEDEEDEVEAVPAAPAAGNGAIPVQEARPSATTGKPAPPAKRAKVATSTTASPAPTAPASRNTEKIAAVINRILSVPVERPFELLGLAADCKAPDIRKAYRKLALLTHPDKNPGMESQCKEALIKLQQSREQAENELAERESAANRPKQESKSAAPTESEIVQPSHKCQYPGCDLPPCKQCPNRCCTRNITHCHMIARSKSGLHCYFHPPPRSWARNAEI
eukprot:TRINITY_DN79774_c0_g1_i1.p1 TRINITY_DN79774_c0_g1~~TRINITY_DN79774_c0_g1_i1.p1  ORF type:complete len:428 (+),score=93.36 TRINITY_DN79774_c0_g1_i1:111-1394(+)